MSDKLQFLNLLLNKEFFDRHRHLVIRELFPDYLGLFHDALHHAHDRYKRSLNIQEIEAIIYANNPLLTTAQRELIHEVQLRVGAETVLGPDVAGDILKAVWKEEVGRQISQAGLNLIEGKSSVDEIKKLLDRVGPSFIPDDDIEPITTDVDEVLAAMDKRVAWRFNIPALNAVVPGISEGELAIVFARVECGKSAFWVSTVCAPQGFASQGARVLALCNEEPAIRTMLRCISACSGMTKEEIKENPKKAKAEFDKIRKNLILIDDTTMTMDRLDGIVKRKSPDIVIIDQIDKVHIDGSFMRTDQELGAIYSRAREIAKVRSCAVVGLTQASADAEGRTQLHYSMMAESKTSKAAEGDLIIGIGKVAEPLDDPMRFLTMSKNKISGYHGTVNCLLRAPISRFTA